MSCTRRKLVDIFSSNVNSTSNNTHDGRDVVQTLSPLHGVTLWDNAGFALVFKFKEFLLTKEGSTACCHRALGNMNWMLNSKPFWPPLAAASPVV